MFLGYYTYKMNIKTKLLEEYVNFVDNTNNQNKNLWICTIILVFIVIILTIITFRYILIYEYDTNINYINE